MIRFKQPGLFQMNKNNQNISLLVFHFAMSASSDWILFCCEFDFAPFIFVFQNRTWLIKLKLHRLDYVGERNGTCSEYRTINFKGEFHLKREVFLRLVCLLFRESHLNDHTIGFLPCERSLLRSFPTHLGKIEATLLAGYRISSTDSRVRTTY